MILDPNQLLVANYSQLRINSEWFRAQKWDAVILDEGQFIKNPGSQVASVARALVSRHRLVLTGTPIENRLTDLWSLFAFAMPHLQPESYWAWHSIWHILMGCARGGLAMKP